MLLTKFGPFDGNSWEELCQQVFKKKYDSEGYQEMVASPGDFGIEGFTKTTGLAFQCYCPDNNYPNEVLYEKSRDKITTDLNKLKRFCPSIAQRLGNTVISQWIFVTPEIRSNELLAHVRNKEVEARTWRLDILSKDFTVLVKDADFFASEIHAIRTVNNEPLTFDTEVPVLASIDPNSDEIYTQNIDRKNKARLDSANILTDDKLAKLNEKTFTKWLDLERQLKRIDNESAPVFQRLARIINFYESEVEELNLTRSGKPEELLEQIKGELNERLDIELPTLDLSTRRKVADQMIARWLAICTVDFI